jgi:hypothetical protein
VDHAQQILTAAATSVCEAVHTEFSVGVAGTTRAPQTDQGDSFILGPGDAST